MKSGILTNCARHRASKVVNVFIIQALVLSQTSVLFAQSVRAAGNLIVPDGRTQTSLEQNSGATNVHTRTVQGATGFNSFSQFNVGLGNTVNLHVPGGASNLVGSVRL